MYRYPNYNQAASVDIRKGRNRLKDLIGKERLVYDSSSQMFTCVEHGYSISLHGSLNFPSKMIRTIHTNMISEEIDVNSN